MKLTSTKENYIVIFVVSLILIIIGIILLIFNREDNKDFKPTDLNKILIQIGSDFYENKYYQDINNIEDLVNFKDIGISVDMVTLDRISLISEEVLNLLSKNKCDLYNTKIRIYPKSPYGVDDYKIKVELSCEE